MLPPDSESEPSTDACFMKEKAIFEIDGVDDVSTRRDNDG